MTNAEGEGAPRHSHPYPRAAKTSTSPSTPRRHANRAEWTGQQREIANPPAMIAIKRAMTTATSFPGYIGSPVGSAMPLRTAIDFTRAIESAFGSFVMSRCR